VNLALVTNLLVEVIDGSFVGWIARAK